MDAVFLKTLLVALVCGALGAGVGGLMGCENLVGIESGVQCSDGKDNDSDSKIDCADEDCAGTLICSGHSDSGPEPDVRLDSVVPQDISRPQDHSVPVDIFKPMPDQGTSSYLQLCSNPGQACPDGETVCILAEHSTTGYCSPPCTYQSSCEPGPLGQEHGTCSLNFNNQWYCLFFCQYGAQSYPCPTSFNCTTTANPSFKICLP